MKLNKEERTEIECRTLESLQTNYQRFMESGGLKTDAKNFNNVITEPILKVPLDQVKLFLSFNSTLTCDNCFAVQHH